MLDRIRSLTASMLAVAAIGGGCSTTVHGGVFTHDRWFDAEQALGTTVVLPARVSPDLVKMWGDDAPPNVAQIVQAALANRPGTELTAPDALLAALGSPAPTTPLGDTRVVAAAKELSINTVCIISLAVCRRHLSLWLDLGVPPIGWSMETEVGYALRVVDVESGDVLLEAVRTRVTGGPFALLSRQDLEAELVTDIEIVFKHHAKSRRRTADSSG